MTGKLTQFADKSGIITTANGLRIACLGGIYEPDIFSSAEAAPVCTLTIHSCLHHPDFQLQGFSSPYFTTHTIERLLSNTLTTNSSKNQSYTSLAAIKSAAAPSQLIDVLISNVWPSSISQLSSAPLPSPELASIGVHPLDDVIRRTKPRYHFAAGGGHPPKFWEREPFVWDDEEGRVTRFVSVGAFGGEPTPGKKQRVRVIHYTNYHD